MSAVGETFFTSVGCMDGRVHEPVAKFGRNRLGVKYADTITEAGLVGLLAKETIDEQLLESIKKKITISLEKHHSSGIVVHGHQECAGNPVGDEQHKADILKAASVLSRFVPETLHIIPVFVKRGGDGWVAEELLIEHTAVV